MNKQDVYIVIPGKDEASRIATVIHKIQENGFYQIVVVDDGSQDDTFEVARGLAPYVLQHSINLGVGAATQTGIEFALVMGAEYIVTIDADTQHNPSNIHRMLEALQSADLVIGSRFKQENEEIPRSRRFYNAIANLIAYILTGIWITDSQSGFRAMNRAFAQDNPIEWNGFEYCIEMLRHASIHGYRISEVPIDVSYSKETMEKGQNLLTGVKTLGRIISRRFHD